MLRHLICNTHPNSSGSGDRPHTFVDKTCTSPPLQFLFQKPRGKMKMDRFMHQDEQELLSVWEGWHRDENEGGLIRTCAPQARREEVEYVRRHKNAHKGLQRNLLT